MMDPSEPTPPSPAPPDEAPRLSPAEREALAAALATLPAAGPSTAVRVGLGLGILAGAALLFGWLLPPARAAAALRDGMVLGGGFFAAAACLGLGLRGLHRPPLRGRGWWPLGLALAFPLVQAAGDGIVGELRLGLILGPCLALSLVMGGLSALLPLTLGRGEPVPLGKALAWAGLGMSVSTALLARHCPTDDLLHLLVAHALGGALLAGGVAVWADRRLSLGGRAPG